MSDVASEIKVGDTAPDFNLKDQDQQDVKLSDYRGKKNVVLCFYPLDWSPVCQGENKCLTDDFLHRHNPVDLAPRYDEALAKGDH